MSKSERFQAALERTITNPSPAMAAYIAAGRAHIAAQIDESAINQLDDAAWESTLDQQTAAWEALTPDEQAMVSQIAAALQ